MLDGYLDIVDDELTILGFKSDEGTRSLESQFWSLSVLIVWILIKCCVVCAVPSLAVLAPAEAMEEE